MNQDDCTHSDEERLIVGTWEVGVEMDYNLMDVYEFFEYEVTCFDKDTNSRGFFCRIR